MNKHQTSHFILQSTSKSKQGVLVWIYGLFSCPGLPEKKVLFFKKNGSENWDRLRTFCRPRTANRLEKKYRLCRGLCYLHLVCKVIQTGVCIRYKLAHINGQNQLSRPSIMFKKTKTNSCLSKGSYRLELVLSNK